MPGRGAYESNEGKSLIITGIKLRKTKTIWLLASINKALQLRLANGYQAAGLVTVTKVN